MIKVVIKEMIKECCVKKMWILVVLFVCCFILYGTDLSFAYNYINWWNALFTWLVIGLLWKKEITLFPIPVAMKEVPLQHSNFKTYLHMHIVIETVIYVFITILVFGIILLIKGLRGLPLGTGHWAVQALAFASFCIVMYGWRSGNVIHSCGQKKKPEEQGFQRLVRIFFGITGLGIVLLVNQGLLYSFEHKKSYFTVGSKMFYWLLGMCVLMVLYNAWYEHKGLHSLCSEMDLEKSELAQRKN